MILEEEFEKESGWIKERIDECHFKFTSPNGRVYSRENNQLTNGAFLYYFDYSTFLENKLKNKKK